MTVEELLTLHDETAKTCRDICKAKNHDYTNGSGDPFANFRTSEVVGIPLQIGILLRMLDKMKRIQTFVEKGELMVEGESYEDACHDLINYAFLIKASLIEENHKK